MDNATYARVHEALDRARRNGQDPAELLDKLGLLLTPAKKKSLHVETLRTILIAYEGWRPAEFLRRKFSPSHVATPQDLYLCVEDWLADVLDTAIKGEVQ